VFWKDGRAALGRALIAGRLIRCSRAIPLPSTSTHPTASYQVSSLPCLLVAEPGDAELLHLQTIADDPFKTNMGRARRKQTWYHVMARKDHSVNHLLTAAAVGVPKQSTAAQEIMAATQREQSLCKGGKKPHECIQISLWIFQCIYAKDCRLARIYSTQRYSPSPICRLHLPRCFLKLYADQSAACLRQMCSPLLCCQMFCLKSMFPQLELVFPNY